MRVLFEPEVWGVKMFSNQDLRKMIFPLFVEQFLLMLVGLTDTLIVSYAGEAAVSGVSLVNSFNTVLIFLFDALAAGGAVVISQYIGSRDPEAAGHAGSQLCMFSILFGVVCNWGVIGSAAGMGIDLIIRGAIFVRRMKSREWTKFRVI